MDSNWASEHLQVIRTLMERVAIYRRALGPIMLSVGGVGCAAAIIGLLTTRFDSNRAFTLLWLVTAIVAAIAAYLLARRQALKEQEPFWSPPTQRVTQALLPGFFAGGMAGLLSLISGDQLPVITWLLAITWVLAYGCALHAAGFFMQRGIKLLGLCCVVFGSLLLITSSLLPPAQTTRFAHATMGFFFGIVHLAYGSYLHLTERRGNA